MFCFADHFNPILDQISKLEDVLAKVQFEQHWLEAEGDRHAISKISKLSFSRLNFLTC